MNVNFKDKRKRTAGETQRKFKAFNENVDGDAGEDITNEGSSRK